MAGRTGGDIYSIGNNFSKSAWAKTHPTDTTTDSLSLAIKRHSFSWVSERDLVGFGFGFGLGCIFFPEMLSVVEIKELQGANALFFFLCCFLHSSSVFLYLLIFPLQYFFSLYHCPIRKITWSTHSRCLLLAARITRLNLWLYSTFATATNQETTNFTIYEYVFL